MGDNRNRIWSEITRGDKPEIKETVAMHSGTGYRSYGIQTLKKLKMMPWLISYVQKHSSENQLIYEGFNCIHLRGCSKPFMGSKNNDIGYNTKMTKTWPTQNDYLKSIHDAYMEIPSQDKDIPTYIVSDNKRLGESWINRYQKGKLVTQSCDFFEESGIHLISKKTATAKKISKEDIPPSTLKLIEEAEKNIKN